MEETNFANCRIERSIMSQEQNTGKKTPTENFGEMFRAFGDAISEIFDDPKLTKKKINKKSKLSTPFQLAIGEYTLKVSSSLTDLVCIPTLCAICF